ncbi:MAG: response regulator, partial [bacterium]|nr:response regulator [bacterium]
MRRYRFRLIFMILLMVLPMLLVSTAEGGEKKTGGLPVMSLAYLEDTQGTLTLDEVRAEQVAGRFIPSSEKKINLGFTNSVLWIHCRLVYPSQKEFSKNKNVLLELGYPLLDYIDCYVFDSAGLVKKIYTGDKRPFENREVEHRNFVFNLPVKPGETQSVYLRIKTESSLLAPLALYTPETFVVKIGNSMLGYGLFYGVLVIMVLYNLFLFLVVNDLNYIRYSLYVICFIFGRLSLDGFGVQYFWTSSTWWANTSPPFFMACTGIGMLVFSRSFLKTRENSRYIDIAILVSIALCLCGGAASFILPYNIAIRSVALLAFTMPCLLLLAGFLSLVRGYRSARFYIIAWTILLICLFFESLLRFGIIATIYITDHPTMIGSLLEVILLSFALGDRINLIRQEKDEAQIRAIENLHIADKLKDEFLANTSHELRTPLNGIIGIADSLVNSFENELSIENRGNLSLIISSGKRLANLVNDILDFSKLKNKDINLNFKPLDIHSLTDVVLELSKPLIGGGNLVLENEIPPGIPPVLADENRLQQILFNLVGNAIKFTDSGRVAVSAAVSASGTMVELSVSDSGIGIPEEKLEAVFESFEQVDGSISREYGGTGIGLSITRQLVELHGGTIAVESQEKKGSRFFFTLSIAGEKAQLEKMAYDMNMVSNIRYAGVEEVVSAEIETDSFDSEYRGTGDTILAVDDDLVNLQVIKNYLAGEEYTLLLASSGEQALEIIRSRNVDLLLLDIMMPRITGYQVCRILREHYSLYDLPVIMLTARDTISDLITGFDAGANDYLIKPINKEELIVRVATLVTLKRTVREHKEAQFKLLQDRMNPHFLFNALNTIHALMYKDVERANKALLMLAQNYRFLMNQVQRSIIGFDEEWEFVKNYLELEELQFDDTLSIEMHKDGDFSDIKIPPLTIQPLVENSLKHGLRNKSGSGFIEVTAVRRDDEVRVRVIDDGVGLQKEDIMARSLGNIKQRLQYFFESAELT